MSSIDRRTTPEQLAARVSEALEAAGIHAVLSGGGAVTIYTDNAYQSKDLDFVSSASTVAIQSALEPLGFRLERRRYFAHPDTDFLLEFPAGPLGFGHLVVDTSDELTTPGGVVRIISPTHCVMDRLAAWFHWADRQGLDQAVSVLRVRMSTWQRCGHGRRRRVTLRSSRHSWSFFVLMPNQDGTETSASSYL